MRLVHHQHRMMPLFHRDERGEIGAVSVGAVHAFDQHQCASVLCSAARQNGIESTPVVVRKYHTMGARKLSPLHAAVVQLLVTAHQIIGAHEMRDCRYVGGVASHKRECGIDAKKCGQRPFKLTVNRALTGDDATRGDRRSPTRDRQLRRFVDLRVS